MIIFYSTLIGLFFGSFISNSLWQIRRIEKSKSAHQAKPARRSVCGDCGHELAIKDLVPVLSWLSLGGKCRYCQRKLSLQYPLVEALTASLFGWSAAVWTFGEPIDYARFIFWLLILTGLLTMAIYDLRWMELPNKVMKWVLLLTVAMVALGWLQTGAVGYVGTRLVAALASGGAFYGLHVIGRGRWMGGGDVKLVFVMGLLLGGQNVMVAMFLGFLSAAIVSIWLLAQRRLGRKDLIPFGPFLIGATFIAALHGQLIMDAYINWLGY